MNKDDVKENVKNVDVWLRGLFIIVFGTIVYFVLFPLIWILVLLQFFTKAITGNLNEYVGTFSDTLISYVRQILNYITFRSEIRPFPFGPWQDQNSAGE